MEKEKLSWQYLIELTKLALNSPEFCDDLPEKLTIDDFVKRLKESIEYHREVDATELGINENGELEDDSLQC